MIRLMKMVYRLILVLVFFAGLVAVEHVGLIDYLSDPIEAHYLIMLIGQHLKLVGISMAMATMVGISIGILFTRQHLRKYAGIVMYFVSLGQTIPSLAVLALAMSYLGIGTKPAVFALFIYSILPIARNTIAGITSVPPSIIDAARGLGLSPLRVLVEVELPNAMKVILTGFRVALVVNIGTAALGYLIGAGGLGDLIFSGIDLMQPEKLLAGAIPTALMALFCDYSCSLLGLVLVSKGLRLRNPSQK
jgi:osmoprotectant transport system permease protein